MENYLKKLNDKQLEAVKTIDGPLLVLAGAGSGKTTVLTNRIAYILQNTYARPWNILAVTFTNKAANEMKERIERIVGEDAKNMWIGTFHSICVRILRKHIDRVDYNSSFIIYDSADTKALIKECIKELGVEEKIYPPRYVLSRISNAKNNLITPEDYEAFEAQHNIHIKTISALYSLYQKKLKKNNALDFDDIIMLTVKILRENPDVAEEYQEKFQYILVDEYQDTNNTQYALIGILAQGYGNICVVGDDDQSIYKFRGANVNNILDFEGDYDGAKRIMLEQNYRSTSIILNAANDVIAHNNKRMGKNLWTDKDEGEKITTYTGWSEKEEGQFIAASVVKRYKESGRYSDCAVLYRTNAQSRAIEDAFMREAIPYKVLAGLRFYDRKEIKDIIAYLRVIYNFDDLSLVRIINEPKRKIGTATIDKVQRLAEQYGVSCFEIISEADSYPDLKSAAQRLKGFAALIRSLRKIASESPIYEFVQHVINDSGYMDMLKQENTVEAKARIDNVEEFLNVVREYSQDASRSGELGEFLESITLVSDIDDYDQSDDYVVLMTIHSAKGLEFPVVFLAGLEEGLFPGMRSTEEDEDIEEERRLCYVAITRAKEKLFITKAMSRFKFGQRIPCEPSRFFKEIPPKYLDDVTGGGVNCVEKARDFGIRVEYERKPMPRFESDKQPPAVDMSDFLPGDRVRHRKFGDGTVVSAQSFGKDSILVIDFDTVGAKRLMAAFAKLEKIL